MKLTTSAPVLAFLSAAAASPYLPTSSWTTASKSTLPSPASTCLNGPQATSIVNKFASLLTAPQAPTFSATADALLASDFTDTSDSINYLAGYPPGSTTFPSKSAFIEGQGANAPIGELTTYDIFYSCNQIAWRWLASGIGSGVASVKGINTFTCNVEGQIESSWSEFNSLAWAEDYGKVCQ